MVRRTTLPAISRARLLYYEFYDTGRLANENLIKRHISLLVLYVVLYFRKSIISKAVWIMSLFHDFMHEVTAFTYFFLSS